MHRELKSLLESNPYINNVKRKNIEDNKTDKYITEDQYKNPENNFYVENTVNFIDNVANDDVNDDDMNVPVNKGAPTPRTKLLAKTLMKLSSSKKISKKKEKVDSEFIEKANSIRNEIVNAFKTYLVKSGKSKKKRKRLNIPGVTDTAGVYKFSENEENTTFKITLQDILDNSTNTYINNDLKNITFNNISLRVRESSIDNQRQVNIHPSFYSNITIDGITKNVSVNHNHVRVR